MTTPARTRRRALPARALPALVLPVLVLSLTGACTVGPTTPDERGSASERRQAQRAAVADLLADGTLVLDLDDPPARVDLALPEGRTSIPLERDGGGLEVLVTAGGQDLLRTPADTVVVSAADGTAPPGSVVVVRRGLTDDELRDVVDGAVADLGVDRARADLALRDVSGDLELDTTRVLATDVAPPASLEVEVGRTALEGEGFVNYHLDW
ncbi:hypothetical protein WDZ16_09360 [Pseudokineococcus marinus]|uniref:Lipoprotein n=1 Tax=Pseudokineococcus marinus TaxID=351215 RepID=A0A849BHD8_9ACTN|nr:hypothetical protein [Pseudokineococcus marinus]NNH22540.1 hypothetical protein [Pseudokineococcus marinus]